MLALVSDGRTIAVNLDKPCLLQFFLSLAAGLMAGTIVQNDHFDRLAADQFW